MLEQFQPHQLLGRDHCFHLHCKMSLDAWVSHADGSFDTIKRRLIRKLLRKLPEWTNDEFGADMSLQEMGTFTDEDVARAICRQKNEEARRAKAGEPGFGCVWEVKSCGVNKLLPYEPVQYGIAEYVGTDIDSHLRRRNPTQLIDCQAVQKVGANFETVAKEVNETLCKVKAMTASL